jgi:hypothetical protein
VFAVGAGGKSATVHNLRKVIEPPLRKRVATRTNPAGSWSFLVVTDAPLRIDNAGRVRFRASMWLPKDGPSRDYDVVVQMTPGGPSAARVVSITTVKAP